MDNVLSHKLRWHVVNENFQVRTHLELTQLETFKAPLPLRFIVHCVILSPSKYYGSCIMSVTVVGGKYHVANDIITFAGMLVSSDGKMKHT